MKLSLPSSNADRLFGLGWVVQALCSLAFSALDGRAALGGVLVMAGTAAAFILTRRIRGWLRPLAALALLFVLEALVFPFCFQGRLHVNEWAAFFWGPYPLLLVTVALACRSVDGALTVGASAFSLALVYLGLRFTIPPTPPSLSYTTESAKECDLRNVKDLGYELCPSSVRVKTCRVPDGESVFRATITSDGASRRVLPFQPAKPKPERLLAIGCSRTFGDGVSDDETFPNYLARDLDVPGNIYALSAWGPGQLVGLLSRPDFWKAVPPSEKLVVVNVGIISHISRSTGAYVETVRYNEQFPKYRITGDTAQYVGTLGNYSFWKFLVYPLLNRIQAWQMPLFQYFGASTKDYLDHLRWIRRQISRHSKQAEFYLVLHPGNYGLQLKARVPKAVFESLGFTLIDATELFSLERPYILHPADDHLSPEGNRKLAEFVAAEIRLRRQR